jgi:3-dehydroquinate dehydratase
VIVAVHGPENGGAFEGDLDERFAILHAAAEAGAAFVDIDWSLSLELGEVAGKCHRIVSRHDHTTCRSARRRGCRRSRDGSVTPVRWDSPLPEWQRPGPQYTS